MRVSKGTAGWWSTRVSKGTAGWWSTRVSKETAGWWSSRVVKRTAGCMVEYESYELDTNTNVPYKLTAE